MEPTMADFVRAEGVIHMISPIQAEFTLCGDAFDLASDVADYAWQATTATTVTCPICATVVRDCQGVRTRASRP